MDYRSAGVNIEAGNEAVDLIKRSVARTHSPQVLGGLGLFSACYELPTGYTRPVLVSCTDGVGTKVKLAIETDQLDGLGIDLVAMCVNDLICCGAKPLFFLDYVACHELVPAQMKRIVDGMVDGCLMSDCSLVGGEMAEMNDLYAKGDFDLAGFCVGVVEKDQMLDGQSIQPGNWAYGLPSSGIHSNGFSLVRKVLTPDVIQDQKLDVADILRPTRIYVKEVLALIETGKVTGLAHITGGGLMENVARVLPAGLTLELERTALPVPPIFDTIQQLGSVTDDEMARVFNMGVGMVVVTDAPLPESDECRFIGRIRA